MKAPLERRNMSKYCKFHKDKGHDTTECFQLRNQIENLIQGGYLQEYISGLVTAGQQNTTTPRASALAHNASISNPDAHNDGLPHKVRTMSAGHAASYLAKIRKDSVSLVAMGHQVNMAKHVAKLSKRKNTIVSFTDDEARWLIHPHINTLVVTLNVTNRRVFRILIDTRVLRTFLFTSAFRQMNVGGATSRPIKTPLYGFSGERVYAEWII